METENNCVLLYQAWGRKNIFNQILFSLLTLHHHLAEKIKEIPIVIYTDNPAFFLKYQSAFNLNLELLVPEKVQEYKGPSGFIHRIKVCIIRDCLEKYKANILYLDSDTYFKESPVSLIKQIDSTTSIMNSDDYDLEYADELYENMDWLQIRRAIRNYDYVIGGQKIKIPSKTRMWNAGVIGISYKNRHLVDQVLALTDQIYANKKVFTAEQFAFSYILQNHSKLTSTGNSIMHYWPNHIGMFWKNQYDVYIESFLKQIENKPANIQSTLAYELTQKHTEIIKPPKKSLTRKITHRLHLIWKVAKNGKIS